MQFSLVAMLLAVVVAALSVSDAAPAPGGYGKNFKNAHANNAAKVDHANAAAKTNKYHNDVAVNQAFGYNQVKKNTNAATKAAKKNHHDAAKKDSKKAANYNNFGFPGYKGKYYGKW